MKKLIYLLLFALAAAAFVACGGKSEGKTALHEMEKIVEKAEKDQDNLTADEWKELAASFEENEKIANEAIEDKKIGVAGRMKFIALTARWATAYGPRMILPDMNESLKNLGGALDKMLDSLNGDSIMRKALEEDTVKLRKPESNAF